MMSVLETPSRGDAPRRHSATRVGIASARSPKRLHLAGFPSVDSTPRPVLIGPRGAQGLEPAASGVTVRPLHASSGVRSCSLSLRMHLAQTASRTAVAHFAMIVGGAATKWAKGNPFWCSVAGESPFVLPVPEDRILAEPWARASVESHQRS